MNPSNHFILRMDTFKIKLILCWFLQRHQPSVTFPEVSPCLFSEGVVRFCCVQIVKPFETNLGFWFHWMTLTWHDWSTRSNYNECSESEPLIFMLWLTHVSAHVPEWFIHSNSEPELVSAAVLNGPHQSNNMTLWLITSIFGEQPAGSEVVANVGRQQALKNCLYKRAGLPLTASSRPWHILMYFHMRCYLTYSFNCFDLIIAFIC